MLEVDFLRRLAAAAASQTLPRFRSQNAVSNKLESGFDPVTEADREAEKAIRALINAEFPEHGILGEEFGKERIEAEHVWVIDPIDGTRSFISGIPLWGTLVGLTQNGDAVAGMMAQPYIGELFYTVGDGAFCESAHGSSQLSTRKYVEIGEAIMCTTTPALFTGAVRKSYDALEAKARLARYGTDCYAYAMLAAGQVDLVVEVGLLPYDIVALIPVIEQAGGVITSFDGGPAEGGGNVIAACNARLHAQAMEIMQARQAAAS